MLRDVMRTGRNQGSQKELFILGVFPFARFSPGLKGSFFWLRDKWWHTFSYRTRSYMGASLRALIVMVIGCIVLTLIHLARTLLEHQ